MTPGTFNYLRDLHGVYISGWTISSPPQDDDIFLLQVVGMDGVYSCIKRADMDKLIDEHGLDVFAESAKLQIMFNGVDLGEWA